MAPGPKSVQSRRVTLVADELLGYVRTGGLGTATTFLSLALARMGNDVELLYVGDRPTTAIGPEWASLYADAGVSIRMLERSHDAVEPSYFARMRDTDLALRADPPDVVITQDLASPAYTALRLRHLGLAFDRTLFVVYCHGTRQWITDVARKVRVLPGALSVTALERASLELADVVVSPSEYLIEWMQGEGWRLPARSMVIPHLTRSVATGERQIPAATVGERPDRVVFFGRLEERKGVRPFIAALNALAPELLERIELEFLGRPTTAWTPERVEGLLSERARSALRRLSFETDLDQHEALARLRRPGTLAVMPSFAETFGNTVRECLEHGIPFIASNTGATAELIAAEDRPRVLFEPTAEALSAALLRFLSDEEVLRPARAAFDPADSLDAWARVIEERPGKTTRLAERPAVDVVVVHRGSQELLSRCLAALGRQRYSRFQAIVAATAGDRAEGTVVEAAAAIHGRAPVVVHSDGASVQAARQAGLEAGSAPFVVFLDDEDEPGEQLLDTLVDAQAACSADVVSCGLLLRGNQATPTVHFFLGEPGGLGLLSNSYGTVALLRRALLDDLTEPWPVEGDPDWPLLARLSASGARIVSIPTPLVSRVARPGDIHRHPTDALIVTQELEGALPESLRSAARLAAGLAADSQTPPAPASGGLARRARHVIRNEGLSGLAHRGNRRRLTGNDS